MNKAVKNYFKIVIIYKMFVVPRHYYLSINIFYFILIFR